MKFKIEVSNSGIFPHMLLAARDDLRPPATNEKKLPKVESIQSNLVIILKIVKDTERQHAVRSSSLMNLNFVGIICR